MRGDMEERILSWWFDKEMIENSPSRRDGISAEIEAQIRLQYCRFIRSMCTQFRLGTIPTATALMFCHRFYALQSLAKNDWKTIATTCVFLSSKSEDSFRSLDDIVRIAYTSDVQNLPVGAKQKECLQKKRELIEMAERVVLTTLRFDTNVDHFYRPLHNAMKLLGLDSQLRHDVWKLVACWLDTTLCLEHKPEWIAAASLDIMDKLRDLKLPDVRGLPLWSEKFAPEKWDACIHQMVQILRKRNWPEHTKLMGTLVLLHPEPVPNAVSGSEQQPEQATSKVTERKIVTPDSVLDQAEVASKMDDPVLKKDTVVLELSCSSEDAPEQKAPEAKREGLHQGLDKAYAARIREAIRKRKHTREVCPNVGNAQLDVSSEGVDDWIERVLESGIIVGSKPVSTKKEAGQRNKVILLDTSCEEDDSWIEKELEEGIIVDSKPAGNKKLRSSGERGAALKLENCFASNLRRGQKRERDTGLDLRSKRQRTGGVVQN
ncbi:Cyclin family protein [Rhynchospora pubera]|uniref:Cyclin family protein n=1 Tax=Rhynchospora pubera TaxID=906938 RepID=A0AAV8F8V6_9POAL|nr:Cyclin family protein [Rhynchospora pubera]